MSKNTSTDNTIAYLTVALVAVVAALLTAWVMLRNSDQVSSEVAFANIGPISFQIKDYTVRTSLAIQSSNADAQWVKKNTKLLESTLERTLATVEPTLITSSKADKIDNLQAALTNAVSATTPQGTNLKIVVTDLLTSHD